MRFIPLLLVALFAPTLMLGQKNVPGFMGKKWNIQYQAYMWPSFFNPNSSEIQYNEDNYGDIHTNASINYEHHIVAGYSFSKKYDAVADVHFTNTNFDPFDGYIYGGRTAGLYFPGITATGFELGIRKYRKHFAPLGAFVTYKIGYTSLNVEDLNYYVLNQFNALESRTIKGGTKGAPTLSVGFGTNRVIARRFIVSYGFDMTLFASGLGKWNSLINYGSNESIDPEATYDQSDTYLKRAAGRYAIQRLFNLKLGIGFLL